MVDMNISRAATSNMTDNVADYAVASMSPDAASGLEETEYMNTKAEQYFGYYKKIPELQSAINALATWIVGKGYETEDAETQVILEHVSGWGEDTFNSVAWNLLVQKKVYGDAFAEIIRDEDSGTLINLKPLDPGKIKIVANRQGIIKRYELMDKTGKLGKIMHKFEPSEILHLCNNRVADEIHGTSIIEACEQIILMKNEAMDDQRKLMHRNVKPIIFFKLNTDEQAKIDAFIVKMDKCVSKGENIYVPKGEVEFEILSVPMNATLNANPWIQYLDNFFYRAVGVPKIILGGSEEFTEASAKIGYLTYEQVYVREQTEFVADMWNQVGLKLKLNQPVSLQNELLTDEAKDKGTLQAAPPDEMGVRMAQE
jgi:hypothetical protein